MLQTLHDKSKGPVLTFILAAVSLMFAASGVESLLGGGAVRSVAKINGEKVTQQELNEAIFLHKRQLMARMGENIDQSMLDEKKIKEPALETLVQRKLLLQLADEHKMLLSETEISKLITQNPDFQKDGKFSSDTFKAVLAGAGLTPALYKRFFTNDMLLQQVSSGIVDTGFMTDKDIAINTRFTHQTRDIRYITLSLAKEKASITATEQEAKDFYDKNPTVFQSDESAIAEYIEINQADFKPEIAEKDIKDTYAQEVAAFKSDEQRDVSHILAKVDQDNSKEKATALLNDIKKKLSEGKDFAELAREYSQDLGSKDAGGELGLLNAEAFPKEFVQAAKTLKQGEVSNIVESESGLHLILVSKITIPKMPTYEERKVAITTDLQQAKATPLYFEALEKLKDLSFNSADLAEPAKALKAQLKLSPVVTRKGGAGVFANKAVYNAVFKKSVLENNENSDVIEISPTQAVVVHVKEHHPSALIPFADVMEKARAQAVAAKAQQQIAAKIESLKSELKAGGDIEQLANKNGFTWQVAIATKRTNPDADPEVIDAAFKLPKTVSGQPAVDDIKKSNGDYIVLAVSNIKDGLPGDINPMESKAMKTYVSRAASLEAFEAIQDAIKTKSDIKIYE